MVENRNVVNFLLHGSAIGCEPGVWLAVTSVSFDISVLDFWTLTALQDCRPWRRGPGTIADEIDRHRVTHLQMTHRSRAC